MVDDWEDFYKKENYRATLRESEKEKLFEQKKDLLNRKEKLTRQEKREQQRRESRHFEHQKNLASLNNQERRAMNQERLEAMRDLAIQKQENSVLSAEVQATGTVEAETIRGQKEIALKHLSIQAQERLSRLLHRLKKEDRNLDFEDTVKRKNLDVQEYALLEAIRRKTQRAEHQELKDILREKLKHSLVEKLHAQRLEKDRMTHETDEKIRFAYAMAELRREFADLTKEELKTVTEVFKEQWEQEENQNFPTY